MSVKYAHCTRVEMIGASAISLPLSLTCFCYYRGLFSLKLNWMTSRIIIILESPTSLCLHLASKNATQTEKHVWLSLGIYLGGKITFSGQINRGASVWGSEGFFFFSNGRFLLGKVCFLFGVHHCSN